MKKLFNYLDRLPFKIVALLFVASCMATSCSAYPSKSNGSNDAAARDSVMRRAVGDSIYSIITEAKKIKAEVIKLSNDSTEQSLELQVKSKDFSLVQFIMADPKIYAGNTPVYGTLMPSFTLTFTKKKEECIAKFDFGLRKWAICDAKGNVIKTYDLSSNDMLRFANITFPNNKFIHSLINAEKK